MTIFLPTKWPSSLSRILFSLTTHLFKPEPESPAVSKVVTKSFQFCLLNTKNPRASPDCHCTAPSVPSLLSLSASLRHLHCLYSHLLTVAAEIIPLKALKAPISYMKWPKSPPSAAWPSLSQPAPVAFRTASLWSVDQGQGKQGPGNRWICVMYRHHTEVDSSCASAFPGACLKDSGWRGILSSWWNFKQCTWLFILLGSRNGQRYKSLLIHGLQSVVWLDCQRLRRNITRKLITRKSARDKCV